MSVVNLVYVIVLAVFAVCTMVYLWRDRRETRRSQQRWRGFNEQAPRVAEQPGLGEAPPGFRASAG